MFMPNSLKNGRYILQEPILGGGMGEVYKGKDTGPMDRLVVVKLVRIAQITLNNNKAQQDALENFKQEVGILAQARHRHVVEIYDCEIEGQGNDVLAYMVMPYCREKSLQDWLMEQRGRGPLQVTEVAALLDQAGMALKHLHDKGIVHRDIKSTNFLVEDRPDPSALPHLLLADFGLAQTVGENISQDSRGTYLYKAPEQWANASLVSGTDQYQLAVMAYYLLTGKHPFEGTRDEVKNQHIYITPVAPSIHISDIPSEVDTVILRALKKKAGERYSSIKAFTDAFRDASKPGVTGRSGQGRDTDALELAPVVEPGGNSQSLGSVPAGERS